MNKEINEEFDVIIVGAGVSGLTAALTILQKDPELKLLIIEKSDRCKGNDSDEDLKISFSFISESNYFLKELLKKINLPILKRQINGNTLAEFTSGEIITSDEEVPVFGNSFTRLDLLLFLSKFEKMSKDVTFIQPMSLIESNLLDSITLYDFVKGNLRKEFSQNFVINIAEGFFGASAKNISALFYLALCNSTLGITNQFSTGPNGITGYLLKGGKRIICDTILSNLAGLNIKYEEEVILVQRNNDYVLIKSNKLIYRCLYTIIAVPPRDILNINMIPELTKTRVATLQNITYANLNLGLVIYSMDCLLNKNLSGDIFCGVKTASNVIIKCTNITRAYPYTFHTIVSQNHQKNIFEQLRCFFNSDQTPKRFIKLSSFRACIPPIGNLKDYAEIRRPINRVFWAGSHTATIWYGQLEGSVQSGTKAATELLYDYKPQTLTVKDIVNLMKRKPVMDKFSENVLVKAVENKKKYLIVLAVGGVTFWLIYRKLKKFII